MRRYLWRATQVVAVMVGGMVLTMGVLAGQAPTAAYRPKRTANGRPDLNGIWQAVNTANWNLQAHSAKPGPIAALGAAFSVPAGIGVVEGGEIPYLPGALARRDENAKNWLALDPELKCYMPGVPRATYMPYPFEIVQTSGDILIAYEFANAARTVYMNTQTEESPGDFWMGWSRGRWDGDTLVIDVTGLNEQTWFDRAGNYHSDQLHVVERYSMVNANQLNYEARIEDPKVFARPWTIRMPLYRRVEPNAELFEYNCVEFAEELMYGHLRRQSN
jgi:hypothetical protein